MKIKRIRLIDYKRFHDLTIDLGENPSRIVALIGPNGCGKSSVFDGMLFLSSAYTPIGSTGSRDYRYHSLNYDPAYKFNNIAIEMDEGCWEDVFRDKQDKGRERMIFTFRSPYRYNSDLDVRETKAVDDIKINNYGASTASSMDIRIEQNYRRLRVKLHRYLYGHNCKPTEAIDHIMGELNKAIGNCLNLQIASLGDIEAGEGTIYFRKEDTAKPFSFNVLSAGEKEIIDILMDLYLRKDEYIDSIYIIDEPELHLNTAVQRKLLIEIDKMIPENCQIWVATHSIGFIRALQDELNDQSQIIRFDPVNEWAKQAYILKPMMKSRKEWQEIFKTALEDLVSLIAPRVIVYCEGKDQPNKYGEEQGLDADVYNNIFEKNHTDVLFVSSGGQTELDQRSAIAIKILSKALPETEILVLKDRDMASGKPTNETDRQQYLQNNPQNHRVLRRFEIENYLFDKEVLQKYCVTNGFQFNEGAYNAFVTDIDNQNLKDETGRIKNICGITININRETFKRNLSKCIDSSMRVYQELEEVIFNRM